MASYHLRLKKDTKPNGTRVNTKSHVDYVRREGKYADVDVAEHIQRSITKNTIFSSSGKKFMDGKFLPLYYYSGL